MSDIIENNSNTAVKEGVYSKFLQDNGFSIDNVSKSADNIEIIAIEPERIAEITELLKKQPETQFDLLMSLSGTDYPEYIEVTYHLFASGNSKELILKTKLDRNNPETQSISYIHTAANWHERETFDLLGVKFNNHPDLKRILLPEEWQGHPLRKDYKMEDERLVWNQR